MPTTVIHFAMTADALKIACGDIAGFENLIKDYSSYPDFYYSDRSCELEPYMYFTDGVQFHYLPDTPYNPLYRYWKMEQKNAFLSVPFVNENFRHAKAGFTFYLTNAVDKLRCNKHEEALKYLGCLLHMLEDSTFGLHAMEGPHGADAFVLDRISDYGFQPSALLALIEMPDNMVHPEYKPCSLGLNEAEAVMNLYSRYCRSVEDSRKCCFKYIQSFVADDLDECRTLVERMYGNAVKICADVIKTVFDIADGVDCRREKALCATEIEPYQFPFGGFGRYVFNPLLRDYAVDRNGKKMLLESAEKVFEYGFSFGSHYRGDLRWDIAPGTFKKFTAELTFHKEYPLDGKISFKLINNGAEIDNFILDRGNISQKISINSPAGEFGLSFESTPRTGIMILGEPLFEYC